MKKTAVEWLVEQVHSDNYTNAFGKTYISIELIEKAKAMEKENIINAHYEGAKHFNEFCRHEQYPMYVDSETYLHSNYNS